MTWLSDDNIFSSPDLDVKRHVSLNEESYQFDERIVARHKDRRWFTARDSGCSCPVPFEDYQKLDDLMRVGLTASYREPAEADGFIFDWYKEYVATGNRKLARQCKIQVRTSWDELIEEAQAILDWSQGTDTDRFYGVAPEESTIADYIRWLKRTRTAERKLRHGS